MATDARENSTPTAGALYIQVDCQFKCSVRKGDRRNNPRGGTLFEFKAKISEGLGVAKAKILSFLQQSMPSVQLISEDLYFKKSKGAPQSQYIILIEENFEAMTRARWNLISRRGCDTWANEGKTVLEGFSFEVFMSIHRRVAESAPVGLRRATANRIKASVRQIQAYEEQRNISLGPITRQHVSIHQARQPDGTEFVMPTDNTTRQAQFLDERRNEAARENGGGDEEQNRKKIELK